MDDRKRRLSSPVPAGGSSAQKRKMMAMDSSNSDSPTRQQTASNDAETAGSLDAKLGLDEGFLEAFTKAAIHRQMLEYKRDLERSQSSAERLERDCKASQSRLVHTEECWKQLNDELKAVLGEYEELSTSNGHADQEEGQDGDDETEDELESPIRMRLQQTRHYLNQLVQRSSSSASAASANTKDLATRYEALSAQLIESRSSHNLLKSLLARKQEELDETRSALLSLEKKVDRARSSTVAKIEKHDTGNAAVDAPKKEEGESNANGGAGGAEDVKMAEPNEEEANKTAQKQDENNDDLQEGSSGLTRSEIQELQMVAEMRAKEVEELKSQKITLQTDLDREKRNHRALPASYLKEHVPEYQRIEQEWNNMKDQVANSKAELETLRDEAKQLREAQASLKGLFSKESEDAYNALHAKYTAAETTVQRLRLDRDTQHKQVVDFQQQQKDRISYAGHAMRLVESRNRRIGALVSQVTRLEMKLAASISGGESEALNSRLEELGKTQADLASALPPQPLSQQQIEQRNAQIQQQGGTLPPPQNAVRDLAEYIDKGDVPTPSEMLLSEYQKKIDEQDELISTFRKRLDELSGHPGKEDLDMAENLIREAASANLQVEKANARIAQLETLLGTTTADSSSSTTATSASIAQKIQDDEATIKKLEANLKVSEASMQMLITEVTRLSEAWEMLNVSNQNKVFQLAQYADKLEQVKQERNKERQAKYQLERSRESELQKGKSQEQVIKIHKEAVAAQKVELEALQSKSDSAEQEISALTKYKDDYEKKIAVLESELLTARKEKKTIESELQVAKAISEDHLKETEAEATSRRKAEAEAKTYKEDADRWKERANKASAAASEKPRFTSGKADALYTERLESMLQCNACNVNWLSHTITRCFHVFCKDCIDARLETRQRKCPSCSLPFGAQDVQQLFLQNG